MWPWFLFPFTVHFLSIKPVLSDHLSYVTTFYCSLGGSHKTGFCISTEIVWSCLWLYVWYNSLLLIRPLSPKTTPVIKPDFKWTEMVEYKILLNCSLPIKGHPSYKDIFLSLSKEWPYKRYTTVLSLYLPIQSVPITTKVDSLIPSQVEVYSIHYVIKFISDVWQVCNLFQEL
jgi:hypothetical protein